MNALLNSLIGITFLGIALISTFLMFYLWKFPYDKENQRSSAPQSLTSIHRFLGYAYLIIYIYLMWQMVPRLWSYQIELPARTVFHLTIGMSIGAILIIKITIVRFFKHMEAKLVPVLGVSLLICTMLLIFLALPFSLREAYLSSTALDGDEDMTMERIARVRGQLPSAGITDTETIDQLASRESLDRGRNILKTKCTQCHDLRTVLAQPRTPESWKQTVTRMANRSTILSPITDQDQLEVTAYLIAISPTLQKTLADRRKQAMESVERKQESMEITNQMMTNGDMDISYDTAQAKETFEKRCSQCHAYTQIERVTLGNENEVIMLVQRMVNNGLKIEQEELVHIVRYITETYSTATTSVSENMPSAEGSVQEEFDGQLDGASLYDRKGCSGCHGPEGREPLAENYPKLTGQSKDYMVQQVIDIRDSSRGNGISTVMQSGIQDITDEEIEAIAEYLSNLDY